ncbi:MAG: precorrin-3B C(17)-methyltransferase [Eubacteriales bacterium]
MKLYTIVLGAGAGKNMTVRAKETLDQCEYIVGYKNFVNLLEVDYMDKKLIKTDLGNDAEACHVAMQKTVEGSVTALVLAGDTSVYSTSSLLMDIMLEYPQVEIEMIPGVSSVLTGAATLGSPISNDYVVLSLSEQNMTWEIIEHRLMAAVQGGFVICIHSPVSPGRMDALRKALRILLWKRKPETICAFVKGAGTWGEKTVILSLEELFNSIEIDMGTIVYIGNDQTVSVNGKMHTPRGYSDVEALATGIL